MKTDLLAAIQEKLELHRTGWGLTAQAFHGRPAHEPTMPYMVLILQDMGVPGYETARSYTTEMPVEFHCWGLTDVGVENILRSVEDLFTRDSQQLSFSEGESYGCNVVGSSLMEDPDRTDEGQTVWHGVVILEFMLRRNEE